MDKNDFGHSQERLKFGRVASALTDSGSYGPLPGMLEVKIGLNANYIVEHSLCLMRLVQTSVYRFADRPDEALAWASSGRFRRRRTTDI